MAEQIDPRTRPGFRGAVARFVLSAPVQNVILCVILLNAATMGLETWGWAREHFGPMLHVLDAAALTIFVIEIVLKIVALGGGFFKDAWNVFDFAVVAIALVPAAGPFSVLRALRVLRVLRLINRMPQLRRIADALLSAIPGIGAIAALMLIIFYVGGVMATMLFGERFPEWFGSVPASLYSLFQIMTLESWSMGIVRPVMQEFPFAWAFFVPFILVSAFVMLNLFIAVIVDAMGNLTTTSPGTVDRPQPTRDDEPHTDVQHVRAEIAELRVLLERMARTTERESPTAPRASAD